jgi:hypothetical protein
MITFGHSYRVFWEIHVQCCTAQIGSSKIDKAEKVAEKIIEVVSGFVRKFVFHLFDRL